MYFENLEVWKRSCRLSADVYKTLRHLEDYGFKDLITRASLSVPSNIAEGMVKPAVKDKINTCIQQMDPVPKCEHRNMQGMKIDYIAEDTGRQWVNETKELSAMITGLIKELAE